MYSTLLCLALLPFLTSFSIGKYPCNSLIMCINIQFMFTFLFCVLFSTFIIMRLGIVLCIGSPFVHSCLFPIVVQFYRPLPPGRNTIAVNKYHNIIQCNLILGVHCPVFLKSLRLITFCVLVC